jgi:hypothetical protein
VAIHPQGQFAYVASELSNTVSAYRIGSDGALTSIGSLVATGHYPTSLAVDATGFVYVTNQGDNSVSAYRIGFDGTLTSIGSPVATGIYPFSAAVDPTGNFVYVANEGDSTVSGYHIDSTTGELTSIGSFPTGNAPFSVAVDPQGRFAYVANELGNTVSAYRISSDGTLTSIGSPVATGEFPYSVAITGCTTPPAITDVSTNRTVLWPPNHKMVDVTVNYGVTAGCGGTTTCSLSVTSNEAVNGTDWVVLSPNNVDLRADRLGTGTGRIYTITIFCQDSLGTSSSATVTVRVPHDNGH